MKYYVNLAERISNGLIPPERLKNIQELAKSEEMLLHSIPLKDGTTAKLLSNAVEYDCLIMKDGKVLTAKGKSGTADEVIRGICGFFEHIEKRNRAEDNVSTSTESFNAIVDYLKKYGNFVADI